MKLILALLLTATGWAHAAGSTDIQTILPGSKAFSTPEFDDYQAVYTSRSSSGRGFTLQAHKSGDGRKLALVDIIPMRENVIVAQRQIDLKTHQAEFSAGPYFAWGQEFVVGQQDKKNYSWTRVTIGSGQPKLMTDEIANGGYVTDMFSPTLAALMPMEIGTRFRLPAAYPRKGEFVSSEFDEYLVVSRENLELDSGIKCHCWMLEKLTWAGSTEHIWIAREAPFVFRRVRDVGGRREFASDLIRFQSLVE